MKCRARADRLRALRSSSSAPALFVAAVSSFFVVAWLIVSSAPAVARILRSVPGEVVAAIAVLALCIVAMRSAIRLRDQRAVLLAILEQVGDGLLLIDRRGKIEYANPPLARMLGASSPDDLIGVDGDAFRRRFRPSSIDGKLLAADALLGVQVLEAGGVRHGKGALHPPNHDEVVVRASAAAVHLEGEADVVVSVLEDITASEQRERMEDDFFADAAHAFKTPIAVVKANAYVMSQQSESRSAHLIARQCDRMELLLENLIVLARTRSHALRLDLREARLGPIVQRAADAMRAMLHKHTVDVDASADATVYVDAERLALLVRDLIDEADRRAAPGSAIVVEVNHDASASHIIVRYPPRPLEKCAEISIEHASRSAGARVIEAIAAAHAGAIEVRDDEGARTTTVDIPAVELSHDAR